MKKVIWLTLLMFAMNIATAFAAIPEYEYCGRKVTSPRVASIAGRVLRSKHSTPSARSVAGSALSQREPRTRRK